MPTAYLLPGTPVPTYDPAPMNDVAQWLASTDAERVMLLYGELDPWGSASFSLGSASDSASYTAPGANHLAGIGDLRPTDFGLATKTLERWLNVSIRRPLRAPEPFPSYADWPRRR